MGAAGCGPDGNTLTALVPASAVADGTVRVLIQARTIANTPYTQADDFNTEVGDNDDWDGTAVPENYDFAIAWYRTLSTMPSGITSTIRIW